MPLAVLPRLAGQLAGPLARGAAPPLGPSRRAPPARRSLGARGARGPSQGAPRGACFPGRQHRPGRRCRCRRRHLGRHRSTRSARGGVRGAAASFPPPPSGISSGGASWGPRPRGGGLRGRAGGVAVWARAAASPLGRRGRAVRSTRPLRRFTIFGARLCTLVEPLQVTDPPALRCCKAEPLESCGSVRRASFPRATGISLEWKLPVVKII